MSHRTVNGKNFMKGGIAVAVLAAMMGTAHAATAEQTEIQKLRQEVEALKALIQQQQVQQQQVQQQVQQQQVYLQQVPAQTAAAKPQSVLSELKSKAGASVKLYGSVRLDSEYQFKGGDGIYNRINTVDLNGVAQNGVLNPNKDRFYSNVGASRIGLDFVAPVNGADVGGKIELDFRGGSNGDTVRIRHAYLTYNNWLLGQTTSSFLSLDTQPEMLDFGSPLGAGVYRTPMVRYSQKLADKTQAFVGLEQGRSANRLPTATAKISHSFADDKALVTGRVLAQETRARLVDGAGREYNDQNKFSWGVGVGAKYKFNDQLTLTADYTHLTGDDKYLLYSDQAYDVDNNGRGISLIDQDAVSVGLGYKINEKWRTNIAYGALFYDGVEKSTANRAAHKNDQLQQGWINVFYNPVKPITLGAEYIYGERETIDDRIGRDSRIGVMAKYDF
ncbi:DcaP family trimeric outer membrane transporter [Acinetobacter larvae]|uniref:DcaP-like protein n=1 Tax=Acinetobacter larvae TaxID=1789224 RepID=A0A1B2LWT0_9GAMM|nr:DcaP family trimeric outer membrane transporter [Acinetobacter larvae]AOA57412.1 DcaP-like protein [Acinetobacter larvae]